MVFFKQKLMLLLLLPFLTAESCSSARGINGQKASGINAVTPTPSDQKIKNTPATSTTNMAIPINQDHPNTEVTPKGAPNNSETQPDVTDTKKQSSRKRKTTTDPDTTYSNDDKEEEEDDDDEINLDEKTGKKKKKKEDKGGIKRRITDFFKNKKKEGKPKA